MRALRAPAANDRNMLWLACLLALCAGYYLAFFRLGAAIDLEHDLTAGVASTMRENNTIAAAGPELARTERALNAELNALQIRADHAATVARFIRESARITTLRHAGLVQIDERRAAAVDPRGPQRVTADAAFEAIPLEVTLTGSYRDLVATIRDLAQAPLAMRIEIAAIERNVATGDADRAPDALTARLHITLERFSADPPPQLSTGSQTDEVSHARRF